MSENYIDVKPADVRVGRKMRLCPRCSRLFVPKQSKNMHCSKSCGGTESIELPLQRRTQKTETCWLWTGALNSDGYGNLTRVINGAKATVSVHRVSYEQFVGSIPRGMAVLHRCVVSN